jgi:two-component system response regulator DesR
MAQQAVDVAQHTGAGAVPYGVLVVDPSEIVGWGIRTVLGAQPFVARCLYAPDVDRARATVERYEPRIALVSTTFQNIAAGQVALRLQAVDPHLRCIIFAAANDTTRCWGHPVGAWGWMEREWETARIVELVRAVGEGRNMLPSRTAPKLTDQQQAVLALIAEGATNREIAAALGISHYTVKEYAGAIFRRLGARNRAEAVRRAQRWGVIG